MTTVNLDALIHREDFDVIGEGDDAPKKSAIEIRELESDQFFFLGLRKPDFQRETSEWDPKRVVGLVRTFLQDELIPAVILWKNRDLTFVIDGSHRLSALIAWVQDDYGDGERSQQFFGHSISEDQAKVAKATRELTEREFGSYRTHREAAVNPDKYGPEIVARARRLATISLALQWVTGDRIKAEGSFVRINQQAATITPQELELIKARRTPAAIAARAIIRRATGHQYWSAFQREQQQTIKEVATTVHKLIFEPTLRYPIRSLDLPPGGPVYTSTALRMVYDFVELSVGTISGDEDRTGQRTVEYLQRCQRVGQLICSNHSSSLGLHPAVYFYSWTGKQQPILYLTLTEMMVDLQQRKKLNDFIDVRGRFEEFLMANRSLINQIVRKFGTKDSGNKHLLRFYRDVLAALTDATKPVDIVSVLREQQTYSYLQPEEEPYAGVAPTKFSTQVKAGAVMQTLLPTAPRCPICAGLVPSQAISIDHKVRKADGGLSTADNAQITHPYCNTGYKESLAAKRVSK